MEPSGTAKANRGEEERAVRQRGVKGMCKVRKYGEVENCYANHDVEPYVRL